MPPPPGELEIGRIGRAHGLRGEVLLHFTSNRQERRAVGAVLHDGDRELVISSAREHSQRWIIGFVGVSSREAAEALRGHVLTAAPLDGEVDPAEVWVHELVDARVVDRAGTELGVVASVQANPAHDLLVLDGGTLIPMVFVHEVVDGTVVVDPPEGLLDL